MTKIGWILTAVLILVWIILGAAYGPRGAMIFFGGVIAGALYYEGALLPTNKRYRRLSDRGTGYTPPPLR